MKKEFPIKRFTVPAIAIIVGSLLFSLGYDFFGAHYQVSPFQTAKTQKSARNKTARIMANGDILIHDVLYSSAKTQPGHYDFTPYFEYVKPWISKADLAIGDYEGTISPDYPLAGYPLFNAPLAIADAIQKTGYDVVDLAHNHILDSGLAGALYTRQVFQKRGIDSIGLYPKNRQTDPLLIKKVNGIRIAILGYSYGYNGMEANLSQEEYDKHLANLDEAKIKQDLKKAERAADITIVMPQMGTEYAMQPTSEQKALYHKMIDWGADVIFGGHPHVVEPAEVVTKNKAKKLIIYSMGNFLSNQRLETVGDIWTERGLLMDLVVEKKAGKTSIKSAKAHPTMVLAKSKGVYGEEGYELYNYRTLILEDFIKGGRLRKQLDAGTQAKVDQAYTEMQQHVGLKW
ncbi:CapA family protein [Streptococcus halichoeri]|uniref:CapA family protein n=1 Tax=Streptococcus halichoeri TaxID=254785 RepID=UPI00135A2A98|nr:CapA family protein [Streptococcus halichoeri]